LSEGGVGPIPPNHMLRRVENKLGFCSIMNSSADQPLEEAAKLGIPG
jgi:hypothetical protein